MTISTEDTLIHTLVTMYILYSVLYMIHIISTDRYHKTVLINLYAIEPIHREDNPIPIASQLHLVIYIYRYRGQPGGALHDQHTNLGFVSDLAYLTY